MPVNVNNPQSIYTWKTISPFITIIN
jgi:hypothetical protein